MKNFMLEPLPARVGIAIAGVALGITAFEVKPVEAAILTYDFTVKLSVEQALFPNYRGQEFNGFFSFDTDNPLETIENLSETGTADEPVVELFSYTDFSFSFLNAAGQPFTYGLNQLFADNEEGPVSFIATPLVTGTPPTAPADDVPRGFIFTFDGSPLIFAGGVLSGLDLETGNLANIFAAIPEPTCELVDDFWVCDEPEPIHLGEFTRVTLRQPASTVPEPSTLVGLSLLGLGFLLRQRTSANKSE